MKIGVYALAKNEEKHVAEWAASCVDADVRVVTDTGSTDGTVSLLEAAGVTVARGTVVPWRWDDAHNLSLYHLPADVDVCIRLDLDERLCPGWREAVERAFVADVNNLHYRYVWSWRPDGRPDLVFTSDRIHSRHGFRWAAATHEGLVCWAGQRVVCYCEGLEIHHYRDAGKKHTTDLQLLEIAVREAPQDARARWYYARELDYAGRAEAAEEFERYLELGGTPTERSYACRVLYRRTGDEKWAHRAATEAQHEPDGWLLLSLIRHHEKNWRESLAFADRAIHATGPSSHATDPNARGRALDLASIASWELGLRQQALTLGREAATECPQDERLARNVQAMTQILGA